MKKQFKSVLVALAVAAGALTSQAAAYNGDLIIGFTSTSGNDLVYDLGSAGSLFSGKQWDLSSLLSGFSLTTVNWGVVGNSLVAGAGRTVYTTRGVSPNTVTAGSGSSINTADSSIYSSITTAGAGNSAFVNSGTANSWNVQTINPTLTTQYKNVYGNPNTVGLSSITLWQAAANASAPQALLDFSLGSDGIVTYGSVAVPEPSTYGMVAGAGLLLLSLRRKFAVQA